MNSNIEIYKEIMKKYQNGEYGNEHLSLNEILDRAGVPNLLEQMSIEELQELMNNSNGLLKLLFINMIESRQTKTLSKDNK